MRTVTDRRFRRPRLNDDSRRVPTRAALERATVPRVSPTKTRGVLAVRAPRLLTVVRSVNDLPAAMVAGAPVVVDVRRSDVRVCASAWGMATSSAAAAPRPASGARLLDPITV